jgi:hypothetical protein
MNRSVKVCSWDGLFGQRNITLNTYTTYSKVRLRLPHSRSLQFLRMPELHTLSGCWSVAVQMKIQPTLPPYIEQILIDYLLFSYSKLCLRVVFTSLRNFAHIRNLGISRYLITCWFFVLFRFGFCRYYWVYLIVISNHRFHIGSSELILPPLHHFTSLPPLCTIHRNVMALQQSACQKVRFCRILLSLPQIVFRSTSGANNWAYLIVTD